MNRKRIFISSEQREFSSARKTLVSLINNDPYWSEFFYAFIFENLPAVVRSTEDVYLNEIDGCTIYLGIFGQQYGKMTSNAVSATEQEYDYATQLGKDRLIFVKNLPPRAKRAKRMKDLIQKAGNSTYTTFRSSDQLCIEVQRSLLYWQQSHP